jgi:hypothetical protein
MGNMVQKVRSNSTYSRFVQHEQLASLKAFSIEIGFDPVGVLPRKLKHSSFLLPGINSHDRRLNVRHAQAVAQVFMSTGQRGLGEPQLIEINVIGTKDVDEAQFWTCLVNSIGVANMWCEHL